MVKRESAKNDFYIIYSWLTKLVYSVVNVKKLKVLGQPSNFSRKLQQLKTISDNFFLVNQGGYKSNKANLILKGRFNYEKDYY